MLPERFELGNVHFFDVSEVGDLRIADDHLLGDAPPHADHLDFGRVRANRPSRRCGRHFVSQMHIHIGMRDPAVRARAVHLLQIDVQLPRPPPHRRARLRLNVRRMAGTHRFMH